MNKEKFMEIGVDSIFVIYGKWHCFFRIDNQTFYITATETKKESIWASKQLKYALDKLTNNIKEECAVIVEESTLISDSLLSRHKAVKELQFEIAKDIRDSKC